MSPDGASASACGSAAEPPPPQTVGHRLRAFCSDVSSLLTACVDLVQNQTLMLCCLLSLFCPAYVDTSNWEFPDVCRYYFGKFGQWSSLVFSMVSLIGAMVIYWVLMSNFLYNSGQFIYSKSPKSPLGSPPAGTGVGVMS